MKTIFNFIFILSLLLLPARAQSPAPPSPVAAPAQHEEKPIQDNSFLVEEAYNQEDGVVQHITTFHRDVETRQWSTTFTQEWPVTGQKHQFSFTLAGANPGSRSGFGDLALNYRLQLVGSGETRVAVSPRVSLLVPTGDPVSGHGKGGAGVQFNLPVSLVPARWLVMHSNAGATLTPNAGNELRQTASAQDFNLGQSFIWLAHPRFNVMFETAFASEEIPVAPSQTRRENSVFLNPGVRWAHNFASGLQIVPGISFPIGVGPNQGERGIFLYISFEHPFRRATGK